MEIAGGVGLLAANGTSFSSNNVKRLSFNVTNIGSDGRGCCSEETLAHELGHNFGAQHNRENAGSTIPYYPYAYGEGIDDVFGTVMSYQRPRLPYFSNPSIDDCNGYYCGTDDYTDVARAINNVHPLYEDIFTPIAPSQPSIVSTDYGNEEIYLSVSVANNGGSAISSYTATCTDGTTQYTGTSSTSRITVSGLTNGVGYSCSVTATNAAGTSTSSASSPPVIPAPAPEAPTIDSIAPGNAQATVSFTPGEDNGSPITGYRYIKDDGSATSTIFGATGSRPLEITIETSGNVYATNSRSDTVSKITPDGISAILGATGDNPKGIAIDAAGNVYTANYSSNDVSKISPAGISTILGTTGSRPHGIALDAAGNVYTANVVSNNVSKITPDGISIILGTTGSAPFEIALDAAGNVYTANSDSDNVSKITPAGTSIILGTTDNSPMGIALDAAGNVYTANSGSNNVSKITPAGDSIIFGTTGSGQLAIALDASGNVYTVNGNDNNVSKITSGGISTILGPTGSSPKGIAIDAAGNVYTANRDSNDVSKIAPASAVSYPATGDYQPYHDNGVN